jgi:hypothetical protein
VQWFYFGGGSNSGLNRSATPPLGP